MNPKIDKYLLDGCMRCKFGGTPECKVHNWPQELVELRRIILDCGLIEELKWGVPCYTFNNKNILLMSALRDSVTLGFFKGVLLANSKGILEKPGKNSQSGRNLNFTNVEDILKKEDDIKAYIFEAIEVEKAGLKVEFKKNPEPMPEELENKLNKDPVFKSAFEALTPGKQRGYILYFSQPKNPETRISRIEKCLPKILNSEDLHDKYKSRMI